MDWDPRLGAREHPDGSQIFYQNYFFILDVTYLIMFLIFPLLLSIFNKNIIAKSN
jgi:hypothetical protein